MTKLSVITMSVNVTSLPETLEHLDTWSQDKQGRYICVSNVHMCIETWQDSTFQQQVNGADWVVPDGRPIFWAQKLLGATTAQQVRGMDLTMGICDHFENKAVNIGFYGGSETTLNTLQSVLNQQFPNLTISYAKSPPFRQLTDEEHQADLQAINDANVDILFVGLGCPKQERWMADNKAALNCTMLGVGAAFDFIAGDKKHAPNWMQQAGLEWLFRLIEEPKRLWRRYLYTNPVFIVLLIKQLILGK
ncbi:N-acetylglucosaminyldiphosphoundecaprenol N -acetyl-beta-D-mannosaminyltransferase [BD1-7 clade bacterium]|uniref:N-acetylglucosaminyldiphosphoundecaprenol N -acetyl-beta-D-mannosaminyltransferase n=1 Tax=BD1-7 clade bacterium TaxID=2029982 RepID=A0A5S9N0B3_9GAMM|nr:N-acetylglucosaminyldiphosphoundecaprenol N -acetyl-beta-D-mannosaminyltransferase [BD1-7 clade bacterium]CAA0083146.1 N-acetylglucosaminyldiphosphoundecaprenol N -acetyl-beta-D-mannosaminyltransferase [BD1-7 clade bacterium]